MQTAAHDASSSSAEISKRHVLCQPCATRRLASQISRYHSAKENHKEKRKECHLRLLETRLSPTSIDTSTSHEHDEEPLSSRQPLPDPNQINQQVSQLKQRLDMLRSQSNDLAVRVTAKTMENEEREENLQTNSAKVQLARERLDCMGQCLLSNANSSLSNTEQGKHTSVKAEQYQKGVVAGGGLRDALVSGTQQIQTLRFHFACKVFDMHRLDVGEQYYSSNQAACAVSNKDDKTKKSNESATGVGKIGGLPLPHAGPVLYGVIPPVVLASSLRLVASLTQLVARCLGVVLPHPILVCFKECRRCGSMYDFGGDVIDVSNNDDEFDDDVENRCLEGTGRNFLCSACCKDGMSECNTPARGHQPTKLLAPASSSSSCAHSRQRRSSLLSLVGSSARKAISLTTSATSRAITHMQQSTSSVDSRVHSGLLPTKLPAPNTHFTKPASDKIAMSSGSISRRINHSTFAYLRENYDKSATEYVLNPPRWDEGNHMNKNDGDPNKTQSHLDHVAQAQTFSSREDFHVAEERFATGLQLLQNDVVALCFRAGVDVSTLWPAESVLLNLHSLCCHCRKMAEAR